jgi:hypothetical protein
LTAQNITSDQILCAIAESLHFLNPDSARRKLGPSLDHRNPRSFSALQLSALIANLLHHFPTSQHNSCACNSQCEVTDPA